MRNTLNILLLAALAIVLSGCGREEAKIARTSGYEDFLKQYNRYILKLAQRAESGDGEGAA